MRWEPSCRSIGSMMHWRTSSTTAHSSVIIRAYDNSYINPEKKEKDVFAINVLKTLFLIKYVLEIEANVDNIVSLMITSIDDDRISLKAQVEDALKVLMRQMLIQKNGSIYVS